MSHLNDAVLRRYVDEPDALLSYEKKHLLNCIRCRSALNTVRDNAEAAKNALREQDELVDISAARDAILKRAAAGAKKPALVPYKFRSYDWQWGAVAAACLVIAVLFSYAPFRAYAANLLTIFEPRQFTPLSMTQADLTQLRGVPELAAFGTVHESGKHRFLEFRSLTEAQNYAGRTVAYPTYLPSAVPHKAMYQVSRVYGASFTFDEKKARATEERKHVALPAVPPNLNGSTFSVEIGPIVVENYGQQAVSHAAHKVHNTRELARNAVVVVQAPVPSVRTTSASADEIESYLLSLPNVPEDVKTQIRAIRDPSSTLPIPVPVDKETARHVQVQGAPGLLIGDNTGVGSILVWQRNNTIYSVAGGFTADEITKVANSMTP